ncbi:hypothetical protein BS78_07G013000 [Paspalum vaginatum]|nr:hypothetical protein BS78_07G013000 [Paspalum vaginatum]
MWQRVDWVGKHAVDEDGRALVAVINPSTGHALRQDGTLKKVRVPRDYLDESILFVDAGTGFLGEPNAVTHRTG